MEIIYSIEQLNTNKKTAVAVGYFDGMHLGHQELIRRMQEYARSNDLIPSILTFDMSGMRAEGKGERDLFPREHTLSMAEDMGVEVFTDIPFDSIRDMSPEEFCSVVADKTCLNAGAVFCGEDFRFGKDRAGTVADLEAYGTDMGFAVIRIDDVYINGSTVSTSKIKEAVEDGDIKTANRMLGFPYQLTGEVIHGNHLAKGLGFPTANQRYPSGVIVPKKGVYLTETEAFGERYRSITNVGTRPTLTEDTVSTAETHIIGFSGDLYGKSIKVFFYEFIRPEQKFDSAEELKQVVQENIAYTRNAIIDNFQ